MSSTAPTKRLHPTNSLKSKTGLATWLRPYLDSSVGSKIVVACTGLLLTIFTIAHMLGNLQVFGGPEVLNEYAHHLKGNPFLLWFIRMGLLFVFVLHLALALRLRLRSNAARPERYACDATIQASFASRTMAITGVFLLLFIVFHLLHFTAGVVHQAHIPKGTAVDGVTTIADLSVNYLELRDHHSHHDVHSMVIYGFRTPWISVIYLVAMVFLALHMIHGVWSLFQTLGINTPRLQKFYHTLALLITLAVVGGNVIIVLGVWFGPFQPNHMYPGRRGIDGRPIAQHVLDR